MKKIIFCMTKVLLLKSTNYVVKLNDNLIILNFHEEVYKNKIIYKKNINISDNDLKKFNKSIIFQNNNFLVIYIFVPILKKKIKQIIRIFFLWQYYSLDQVLLLYYGVHYFLGYHLSLI